MKRIHIRSVLLPSVLALLALAPHASSAAPSHAVAHALLRDSVVQSDFDPVWKKFQEAMKKNDRKKVADMIAFPFYSPDLAAMLHGLIGVGHGPSFSREEILKYYDRLFDKDVQKTIASTLSAMPMFDEQNNVDRYIVSIRRDAKGFQWIEFRRDATTGTWMLARMDSIVY